MYSYLPLDEVQQIEDLPVPRWRRLCGYGVVVGGWLALGLIAVDWKSRH